MAIRRKKFIQVPPGAVEKICKALNCKKTAVYDALNYTSDSNLAETIRDEALNYYGGVKTSKLIMR